MINRRLFFVPEVELEPTQVPREVMVKGQLPRLNYPFRLADIYPTIPSVDTRLAYEHIRLEFLKTNELLSRGLYLRSTFSLPHAENSSKAISYLNILFSPNAYSTNKLFPALSGSADSPSSIFELENVLPFPLRLASPQKLGHTFAWIDSNVKVAVENIARVFHLPLWAVQQIVESSFKIYSYLVKQADYRLARSMNFNHSMFLQDRILNLIFGDEIYMTVNLAQQQDGLANTLVLELLKGLNDLGYRNLCTLSVFMGIVWINKQELQEGSQGNSAKFVAKINSELQNRHQAWCIDHIDRFLVDMGQDVDFCVAVILDDNGESVFDMALFQKLLNDNGKLRVTFIVNAFPISNNIALAAFQALLNDPYFEDLRQHLDCGRASVCIEKQVFRSFELSYLQPQTRLILQQSDFLYIKGANFFETFQCPDLTRYHCFTVHGATSILLTDCLEGTGVFVKLLPGETGFTYPSHLRMEPLRAKVTERGR